MAGLTTAEANKILDTILQGDAYTPTNPFYIGLFTTLPAEAGTGGVEPSGGSYARVASTSKFGTSASGSESANDAAITFVTPTGDWGLVVGVGFWTAATDGTCFAFFPLSVNRTISNGDGVAFDIGDFILSA